MIKATTNGNQTKVELDGNVSDIMIEFINVMASTSTSLAEQLNPNDMDDDKETQTESVLYATIMSTCEKLNRGGINVDPRKIAISMLAYSDDKSGPTGSGNSHGDQ